ncbi:hypothetical protein ACFL1E_07090 [Candidatus Omnitrophota bacterium]
MFKKFLIICILASVFCFALQNCLYAEKIALMYTGDSRANIYPCRCPKAPNGGITRRATVIKQIRVQHPDALLLDSGNFFASGARDLEKVSPELDKKRSLLHIRAMELMGYDAVSIGRDEFNFGKEFLIDTIANSNIAFLSCNTEISGSLPFIIKEVGSIKVGIIGIAAEETKDASEENFPKVVQRFKESLQKLLEEKTHVVIALSQLGENLDNKLIEQVDGIDVLIGNSAAKKHESEQMVGKTLYLKPYVWARSLKVAELDIEKGAIKDFNLTQFPLSKDVADDADMNNMRPQCFSKRQCHKQGFVGSCESPGEKDAQCSYKEQVKVSLLIIQPRRCRTCNVSNALSLVRRNIPSIKSPSYLHSDEKRAKKLIKDFNIRLLPAFLLGKEITKHESYSLLMEKKIIEKKNNNYFLLNPTQIGGSYFVNRQEKKHALDLFISFNDKGAHDILQTTKQLLERAKGSINFSINFLAIEDKNTHKFIARYGESELEEDKRALCIIDRFPEATWNYLLCRAENIKTGEWNTCASEAGIDINVVTECVDSKQGNDLLRKNSKLPEELKILYGPLFLLNNQEIFGVRSTTSVEELEQIVK